MIDMSDLFMCDLSPEEDFQQECIRYTFFETEDNKGRPVFVIKKQKFKAVVTTPSNNEMIRFVDATTYTKAKCFTTRTILTPDTFDTQPDEILYKGNHFVIVGIDDYDENGFTRAYATMIEFQQSRIHKGANNDSSN